MMEVVDKLLLSGLQINLCLVMLRLKLWLRIFTLNGLIKKLRKILFLRSMVRIVIILLDRILLTQILLYGLG